MKACVNITLINFCYNKITKIMGKATGNFIETVFTSIHESHDKQSTPCHKRSQLITLHIQYRPVIENAFACSTSS